ncbi:MerR family transcriptional regulator [Helicobacter himalayensis]|uniref:MerR family transcriptional regulator n=1 Tax=Helicobacter himalayensis TaxID=1591088 RepID=UPI003D6FCA2F
MTIIELERKSGISSRKIRFWLSKGLFPKVYRDKNGVHEFGLKDLEWLRWINFYRNLGMSIKDLKHYRDLCDLGDESIKERLEIIKKQKNLEELKAKQKAHFMLEYKEKYYTHLMQDKDYESKSFEECLKLMNEKFEKQIKGKNAICGLK